MKNGMRAVVIGAGMGGLATAASLAVGGADVTVVDRAPRSGGKASQVPLAGLAVDTGPTVLTMRWVFDELFEGAGKGRTLDASVRITRSELLARHVWPDGPALDLWSDVERSADAIGRFAGASEATGYRAFQRHTRRILETVRVPFLRSQRPSPLDLLRAAAPSGFAALGHIDAHRTMATALATFFGDPRLRQLFGRYATYAGSSPYAAPATLNVIAEVEREGVWCVEGGMSALAKAVERLARENGATFRFGCAAREIVVERGRVAGVLLDDGERIEADVVVANADASALAAGALGMACSRAATAPRERSLSAVTWAAVARAEGRPLAHHNVFFSPDSAPEFEALFTRGALPAEPTVYLCAQDRNGVGPAAPDARALTGEREREQERFLVIVNAPATGDRGGPPEEEIDACEHRAFERMSRAGVTLSIRAMARTTPVDFERRFPATGGALYGAASHGALSGLARAGARTRIPGLFLAGGSIHPGAGVPMAALSGRLAAAAAFAASGSTSRSRTGATAGSTSMR
jgi:1-hydroxycarotenoid 3,4-desaturase